VKYHPQTDDTTPVALPDPQNGFDAVLLAFFLSRKLSSTTDIHEFKFAQDQKLSILGSLFMITPGREPDDEVLL